MFLTQQFSATNQTNYQCWHFCPHWLYQPSEHLTDCSYGAFFLNLILHRMQQQERKKYLTLLFEERDGSKVHIREIFLFAEDTNLFDKGMPRYPSDWFVIRFQEHALLVFSSLSPFLTAEESLSFLSVVFFDSWPLWSNNSPSQWKKWGQTPLYNSIFKGLTPRTPHT